MKVDEFVKAGEELELDNQGVADLLGVREETVYKWMKGSKRIPDHYSNLMKTALKEKRAHAKERSDQDKKGGA